ncbi:ribonuclease III [Psittacicella melopsittaci]|uniref:Ribonuclease 3 n=1 Tax=Psittacicella melopsittaci TaxID=2028576 RepID=A0A3A1Y2B9_9GAMM|nr:ribonuclease III [Psittacicella melopsittaci]RIY31581.1 ribonuclease III [Psittacicella melopsittaci]
MPNSHIIHQENAADSELINLERKLGYKFKNIHHLRVATTHSSYCNLENYERYEFLGDSIVNFVIGKYLFNTIKDVDEGALTKMRSALICGSSLCSIARNLDLGYYIRLAKGEIQNNGRTRDSILEDTVEAICAAIYLDSGSFETTEKVVLNIFKDQLNHKEAFRTGYRDPKTLLQEIVQELFKNKPNYVLVRTEGKSHNQTFFAECVINELNYRTPGVGKNKRKAEQEAASLMIRKLRSSDVLSQEQLDKVQHL